MPVTCKGLGSAATEALRAAVSDTRGKRGYGFGDEEP